LSSSRRMYRCSISHSICSLIIFFDGRNMFFNISTSSVCNAALLILLRIFRIFTIASCTHRSSLVKQFVTHTGSKLPTLTQWQLEVLKGSWLTSFYFINWILFWIQLTSFRTAATWRLWESPYRTDTTRKCADAQCDGHPAEYRWCPLFNAAKFGWCPILECRAVTLPRRETRWNKLGYPKLTKRSQPLVGLSSPYCGDMGRRYCCLTSFLSDCWYLP